MSKGRKTRQRDANRFVDNLTGAKTQATNSEKLYIIQEQERNRWNDEQTALHFHGRFPKLCATTIGRWRRLKPMLLRNQNDKSFMQKFRDRKYKDQRFVRALRRWLELEVIKKNANLNLATIREIGRKIYDSLGVPENRRNKMGNGWLHKILTRFGMVYRTFNGEAGSVSREAELAEQYRLQTLVMPDLISEGYDEHTIYNFDETGLLVCMSPNKGYCFEARKGKKTDIKRFTVGLACNIAGEKIKPVIITTAKRHRSFNGRTGRQLGFNHYSNKSAWMTTVDFNDFLARWNDELVKEGTKIALFLDNFSGHKFTMEYSNIKPIFFTANLTSIIQPIDAGIGHSFKAAYRKLQIKRTIDSLYAGDFSKDLFKIDELTAMKMIEQAFEEVSSSTIINCWIHVKFANALPFLKERLSSESLIEEMMEDPVAELQDTIEEFHDALKEEAYEMVNADELLETENVLIQREKADIDALVAEVEAQHLEEVAEKVINEVRDGVTDHQKLQITVCFEELLRRENRRLSKSTKGLINSLKSSFSKNIVRSSYP